MDYFGGITPEAMSSEAIPSPCFVVNEVAVERNLRIIDRVQKESGAKVLLALKGFAMWSMFPLIRRYLRGVTASSVNEALLGKNEFGGEVHTYAPAYTDSQLLTLLDIADHITFNSVSQWTHHRAAIQSHAKRAGKSPACALRINPEHREVKTAVYDPCAPGSRLGITQSELDRHADELDGISGLHFHTLCQANSDALERTLVAVEERFGKYFKNISWINFGGGHHITRDDYDVERLIRIVRDFKSRYGLDVFLEPGEAVALNTGVLVATVVDMVHNGGIDIAILDASATAHMPDVLEMPYRPPLWESGMPGEKRYTYRLGGLTCLAGDVVGDFSFSEPLRVGCRLLFGDMAHYSMVKTTMFNGVHHPAIAIYNSTSGNTRVVREFGYEDFRNRLG